MHSRDSHRSTVLLSIFFLTATLFLAGRHPARASGLVGPHARVISFGDSTTQGSKRETWLDFALSGSNPAWDYDVRSHGLPGKMASTVAGEAGELAQPDVRTSSATDVVLIFFGDNDAKISNGVDHVSSYQAGLTAIASELSGATVVVVSPASIEARKYAGAYGTWAAYDANIHTIRDLGESWAASHGAGFIDLYTWTSTAYAAGRPTWGSGSSSTWAWTDDGIHPTYQGAQKSAELIARALSGTTVSIANPPCTTLPSCNSKFLAAYYRNYVDTAARDPQTLESPIFSFTTAEMTTVNNGRVVFRQWFDFVQENRRRALGWTP